MISAEPVTGSGRRSFTNVARLRVLSVLSSLGLLVPIRDFYNWLGYVANFRIRQRNRRFLKNGAPDGLPMPTPKLMHMVSGRYNLEGLYLNGMLGADSIKGILANNGIDFGQFSSVLDFGCGCGRIIRFWRDYANVKIYGTDYNEALIDWCRSYLPFAAFSVNSLDSRMDYRDGQFDFIYAVSVFTHLTEPLQHFWMDELKRILRPGGYMYITVLGTRNQDKLTEMERMEFSRGNIIVENSRFPGTNICRVFHPEKYFREKMTHGMKIVDFVPGGAKDAENQDVFLLRK